MTTTSTSPSTWLPRAADLPQVPLPAHLFHTTAWAAAWEQAAPEVIRSHHHLLLDGPDDPRPETVSFHLVERSGFWDRLQHDAAIEVSWPAPVLCAGSLYAEYGGAGAGTPEHISAVLGKGLALARRLGAAALVLPNLTLAEAEPWLRERRPDARVFTDMAHTAPVAGGLAALADRAPRRQAVRDLMRQQRRGADRGLRLKVLQGEEMLPWLDRFSPLAGATAERHGTPLYTAPMFRALALVPGAVLLAAVLGEDDLAGAFFSFRHRDRLHLWGAGIDHARQRDLHTYTWLMAESVEYAQRTGATVLDAGRGNCAYKVRHGLTGERLDSLVYLTRPAPALTAQLTRLGDRLLSFARTGNPQP
ncbi:GNAT family N-acetyltransferase [Streptacidiphilus neutrinimicus]|uniref:GNAT family N-acetyltransferase n=1 Tax=Streptacidiphilus neutrinimicus TaxID=105420 RepID=UPI001376EB22|nr:GNAT family N-acetyltransferase [Streptacidiphilus neutrinimicus]